VAGLVRGFSLAAAAVLMLAAVPGKPAQAMSLITPSAAPSAKYASEGLMTQVRGGGGHGGGFHGFGGGGFHGGGIHYGHVFHGGGFRHGGYHRYGGFRFAHHHRHFFHGGYYPYLLPLSPLPDHLDPLRSAIGIIGTAGTTGITGITGITTEGPGQGRSEKGTPIRRPLSFQVQLLATPSP
jgi:hypothetical protein